MFILKNKTAAGQIKYVILITIGLVLIGGLSLIVKKQLQFQPSRAGLGDNYGSDWAWSENFGWFSLDCQDENCGGSVKYWVDVPKAGGFVTGWAWSEYAGWVCFGSSCGPGITAYYDKQGYSGEISGRAKIWVLGDEGWLKLRGDDAFTIPGPFPLCYDCFFDDKGVRHCRICYTHKEATYGYGYGYICSDCNGCEGEGGSCQSCAEDGCYQYGLAYRQDVGKITGWAWNGNWNGAQTGQPGIGWLQFDTEMLAAINPWLQTKQGDVYSQKDIRGLPGTPPARQFNATYLIHTNGTVTNFVSEWCEEHLEIQYDKSCGRESFGTILNLPKTATNYFGTLGRIDLAGMEKGYYGKVPYHCQAKGYHDLVNCLPSPVVLNGNIYWFSGDYTLNSDLTITNDSWHKGNGLVIIEGDLILAANIQYRDERLDNLKQLASVGWLVVKDDNGHGGNIIIRPEVRNLAGVFYAESSIDTCEQGGSLTTCDINPLDVTGSLISYHFDLDRTYVSAERGAEVVTDDGRALVNTPPGMEDLIKGLPVWSAAVP